MPFGSVAVKSVLHLSPTITGLYSPMMMPPLFCPAALFSKRPLLTLYVPGATAVKENVPSVPENVVFARIQSMPW